MGARECSVLSRDEVFVSVMALHSLGPPWAFMMGLHYQVGEKMNAYAEKTAPTLALTLY